MKTEARNMSALKLEVILPLMLLTKNVHQSYKSS